MSAMESLLKTVLNVSGIDIEEVKKEVTTRITAFEANVETLNNTLISHHHRLSDIEKNLETLFDHFNLPYIKSAHPVPEPAAPAPVAAIAQQ